MQFNFLKVGEIMKNKIRRSIRWILCVLLISVVSITQISAIEEIPIENNEVEIVSTLPDGENEIATFDDDTLSKQSNTAIQEENDGVESRISPSDVNDTYLIPDVQLRRIINKKLGKPLWELETYSATQAELNSIVNIMDIYDTASQNYLQFDSLEGLQYLTSVDTMYFMRVIIRPEDLHYIGQLTQLTSLNFNNVLFLGDGSTTTKRLNITINGRPSQSEAIIPMAPVVSLSPLSSLINLTTFNFSLNGTEQTATYTYTSRTNFIISDLGKLTNLKRLYLSSLADVEDTSFSFLSSLQNIEELTIISSPLESVESISLLPKLKTLNINETKVLDFTPIMDKSYFIGASLMSYNYDPVYYDTLSVDGENVNTFTLDTKVKTGSPITNISFSTLSMFSGVFSIKDYQDNGTLSIDFNFKEMKNYSMLNYINGQYDIKKLGFVFGMTITYQNGKQVSYNINSITIGKKVTFDPNYTGANSSEIKVAPLALIEELAAPNRAGYDFIEWCIDKEGTTAYDFSKEYHENLTLYAKWSKTQTSQLFVEYRNLDNVLLDSETVSGNVGADYRIEAKEIKGYILVNSPLNASGTFTSEPITIVFLYDQVKTTEVPTLEIDSENKQISRISTSKSPSTGDTTNLMVYSGICLLVGLGFLVMKFRKKITK